MRASGRRQGLMHLAYDKQVGLPCIVDRRQELSSLENLGYLCGRGHIQKTTAPTWSTGERSKMKRGQSAGCRVGQKDPIRKEMASEYTWTKEEREKMDRTARVRQTLDWENRDLGLSQGRNGGRGWNAKGCQH
ncbi:hypothetical protein R1flu_024723 [Riccia fluitans]|uniref:GIY-YIG homing endonuclease n=1 Tax=Riccia fluitans TaxID=41844 RepID=A0ABD1XYT6_9MARC